MKKSGIVVPLDERFKSNFRAPAKYYIVNALGDAVYYPTRSRQSAQDMADAEYGKGKYAVRVEMKAQVR